MGPIATKHEAFCPMPRDAVPQTAVESALVSPIFRSAGRPHMPPFRRTAAADGLMARNHGEATPPRGPLRNFAVVAAGALTGSGRLGGTMRVMVGIRARPGRAGASSPAARPGRGGSG